MTRHDRRPPPRRRNVPLVGAAAALILAGVVTSVWLGSRATPPATQAPPPAPEPDDLEQYTSFGPESLYRRAVRSMNEQKFIASLPYFRRAFAVPGAKWNPYSDYALALFHGTFEVRQHFGRTEPSTRSSYERVAMMIEAWHSLDEARRLTETHADSTTVLTTWGRELTVWGFPWDGFEKFAAVHGDRFGEDAARVTFQRLRDPTASDE